MLDRLPARAFVTHQVVSPSDATIVAACEQAGCLRYRHGWDMAIDERTDEGRLYAQLIRSGRHGRTFRELSGVDALGRTVFRFEPYQRCFAEHRTRPELYVVRNGTPSTHLGVIREHARPGDFVEDYRETLDRRLTSRQKG